MILGIDPGDVISGFAILDDKILKEAGIVPNTELLELVKIWDGEIAIEMIASYGMSVGREIFDTCVWIGRFKQAYQEPHKVSLIFRRDIKIHICDNGRAKDPNVRRALMDMWPATGGGKVPVIGTKDKPGPLYGVTEHMWAALAVAVTARDLI